MKFQVSRVHVILLSSVFIAALLLFHHHYGAISLEPVITDDQIQRIQSAEDLISPDLQGDFIEVGLTPEESSEKFLADIDKSSSNRCPIFSFVKNITSVNEERIKVWTRAWYNRGFQPYVLTEKDALSRPEYGLLVSKIPAIEFQSGYLRWLALSSVQGGLYVDLDVLPLFGSERLFEEYTGQSCKTLETLSITEYIGFDAFLFSQQLAKGIVRKLSNEKYLKGKDDVWLILHLRDYHIHKTQDKLPLLQATNTVYYQKHRRSMPDISSAEHLKTVLKMANFLNTHRILLLRTDDNETPSLAEATCLETFRCEDRKIKFDLARILPNKSSLCSVQAIDTLAELNLQSDSGIESVYVVFVSNPELPSSKASTLLLKVFPKIQASDRDRLMKQLKVMIQSKQILLIPLDADIEKITLYLEFSLGIRLVRADKSSSENPTKKICSKAISRDTPSIEGEIYELIFKYFEEQVSRLIEFDYE